MEAGGGKRDLSFVLSQEGVGTRMLKGTQRPEGEEAAGVTQGTRCCTVFIWGGSPASHPLT